MQNPADPPFPPAGPAFDEARVLDALWQVVGEAMERRLGTEPVWLSTAGAGVSWLHVRLDDRPKYYGHAPYRRTPGGV